VSSADICPDAASQWCFRWKSTVSVKLDERFGLWVDHWLAADHPDPALFHHSVAANEWDFVNLSRDEEHAWDPRGSLAKTG
jgi:hypothetical protein